MQIAAGRANYFANAFDAEHAWKRDRRRLASSGKPF
jgi:hypothetical protein